MSRVSRIRTALAATVGAACLAVGVAAAPAQASTGTVAWEDGYSRRPMAMTDLPPGACLRVNQGSRNLRNQTNAYVAVFVSTTKPQCEGAFFIATPGQAFPDTFTSFQVRG
ncbi:hypothetical protein [Streptomyces sp. NPDC051577]|uniref:hypothetical protein n=1 Tax=Streptomyces sp. NPDC051577 TaxID=3155166 RepID=UPI00342E11DE